MSPKSIFGRHRPQIFVRSSPAEAADRQEARGIERANLNRDDLASSVSSA
jgi:hypothetical protein